MLWWRLTWSSPKSYSHPSKRCSRFYNLTNSCTWTVNSWYDLYWDRWFEQICVAILTSWKARRLLLSRLFTTCPQSIRHANLRKALAFSRCHLTPHGCIVTRLSQRSIPAYVRIFFWRPHSTKSSNLGQQYCRTPIVSSQPMDGPGRGTKGIYSEACFHSKRSKTGPRASRLSQSQTSSNFVTTQPNLPTALWLK